MSKYTQDELQAKAICVLNDLDKGGERSSDLLFIVAMQAGMTEGEVYANIKKLAAGEVVD